VRRRVLGLLLLASASGSWAAPERPQGANCRLTAPPASAGEVMTPAESWFVYPRTRDIGPGYRGCQTVWAPAERGGWEIVVSFRIEQMAIAEVWPPPPDGESVDHCRYSHGRVLAGGPGSCRTLATRSLPAGCLARSVKEHLYPAMPRGCEAG